MNRRKINNIARTLIRIYDELIVSELIQFWTYDINSIPETITVNEYIIIPVINILGYLKRIAEYMLSYSISNEVYEVCSELEDAIELINQYITDVTI